MTCDKCLESDRQTKLTSSRRRRLLILQNVGIPIISEDLALVSKHPSEAVQIRTALSETSLGAGNWARLICFRKLGRICHSSEQIPVPLCLREVDGHSLMLVSEGQASLYDVYECMIRNEPLAVDCD